MLSPLERKALELSEEEWGQIYRNCFSSESGQLVLEDLANRCYVRASSAVGFDGDNNRRFVNEPHTTYLNEGMRLAFQHIEQRMKTPIKEESERE